MSQTSDLRILPVSKIVAAPELQMRVAISERVVRSYAELMNDEVVFPPVTVFWDGADYILADGFHRLEAVRMAGFSEIECEVKEGQRRDALLFAAGANAAHGFQRSAEDKRLAVDTLLLDVEWVKWADAWEANRLSREPKNYARFDRPNGTAYADPDYYHYRRKYQVVNKRVRTQEVGREAFGGAWSPETALPEELRPLENVETL